MVKTTMDIIPLGEKALGNVVGDGDGKLTTEDLRAEYAFVKVRGLVESFGHSTCTAVQILSNPTQPPLTPPRDSRHRTSMVRWALALRSRGCSSAIFRPFGRSAVRSVLIQPCAGRVV